MAETKSRLTAEDLLRMPEDGRKYELIDGELLVSPAGLRHERIGVKIAFLLTAFVAPRDLGEVYGSSAGYKLPNGDLLSPDVSFVRRERLPGGKTPKGFGEFLPDLVVEILSPGDNPREVLTKVGIYLSNGVPMLLLVDPDEETVAVYRSLTNVKVLRGDDVWSGEEVIPGFRCLVKHFFK